MAGQVREPFPLLIQEGPMSTSAESEVPQRQGAEAGPAPRILGRKLDSLRYHPAHKCARPTGKHGVPCRGPVLCGQMQTSRPQVCPWVHMHKPAQENSPAHSGTEP